MGTICRLRVKGRLDPSWSDRLGGLRISPLEGPGGSETKLEGPLPDEAAVQGVIATLGDLNLALLSLEVMELDAPAESRSSASAPAARNPRSWKPSRKET